MTMDEAIKYTEITPSYLLVTQWNQPSFSTTESFLEPGAYKAKTQHS